MATASSPRAQLLRARDEGRCAFIPYITLGYPDLPSSLAVLAMLEEEGADCIEVGIPFSDPVADGPTIQATTDRALAQGTTLRGCLAALQGQPVGAGPQGRPPARVLFSYYNPLLAYGLGPLAGALPGCGVRGALVTDLIPEEAGEWRAASAAAGVELCFLVASTSSPARLAQAATASTGFVYCVSTLGVTGARRGGVDPTARATVERLREASEAPVAVGFGISAPDDVRAVRGYADGAIVGSALLDAMGDDPASCVARARAFVRPLIEAASA